MNRMLGGLLCAALVGVTALTGAPATASDPDYSGVLATLDSEIPQILEDTGGVGLTLAIVDGQKVIAAKGYGLADRDAGTPVTADTLFHIGSISKTFTAAAVMQLVEQGKVDLDAPLSRYVPAFSLLPRYKHNVITVRTVLDHHSGIPGDLFNGLITDNAPDPGYRAWLVKALARMYPERRVNTQLAYNNSGFVLLQNLVESVTGQSFEDYTRDNLFRPMGMTSSSFNDALAPDSAVTRNYAPEADGAVSPRPREYVNGWAAGSILTSANDMTGYLRMLTAKGQGVNGRVLQEASLAAMTTPQTDAALDINPGEVGLSWFLMDTWAGPVIMHDGGTVYNISMLQVLPESGIGVLVSTNTAIGSGISDTIAARALSLMYTAKTGITPPTPDALPRATADPPSKKWVQDQAGIWAKQNGYDVARAQGRRLRILFDATTPAVYHRMKDGWWASSTTPDLQIRPRRISGTRLLVGRFPTASGIQKSVLAQKASLPAVPGAWRDRFGTYRAVNLVKNVSPGFVPATVRLTSHKGALVLKRPGYGVEVLQPIRSRVAFSFGAGGRNKGDGVFMKGRYLTYMGVRYQAVS
ncbi:MAG: serine hydrolase domain-containing protein [Candidatus Nanopelagicales bacterium]